LQSRRFWHPVRLSRSGIWHRVVWWSSWAHELSLFGTRY
jgi:hypothetical protein